MHTILIEFKIEKNTRQNMDVDKDRHDLSSMIDSILINVDLGKWSGSAAKGDSLIFYCMVEDEVLTFETITNALAGHKLTPFLVWFIFHCTWYPLTGNGYADRRK